MKDGRDKQVPIRLLGTCAGIALVLVIAVVSAARHSVFESEALDVRTNRSDQPPLRGEQSQPHDHANESPTQTVCGSRLACLTDAALTRIRKSPSAIVPLFHECRTELVAILGDRFSDLRERQLHYLFAMTVANAVAPYGNGNAVELEALLKSETLNCGNYGILMLHLADHLPSAEAERYRVHLTGWEGGAVGNHQFLFISGADNQDSLLVDPTIGLVARANFDQVASGQPVDPSNIVLLAERGDVEVFRQRVVKALTHGAFRPSDLLYYFDGLDHLLNNYGNPHQWPTPGAIDWRAIRPKQP